MRSLLLLLALAAALPAQKEYGFDNKKASGQAYLSPQETVKRMKVPDEFEVKLFAGEPDVVNPIAFTIDERGRVWVVECFEYPSKTPAGKMPRDRIVILEDTDGDGACDKRTIFAEGKDFPERFDMASGIEVGHGGVFLGAPPYLWFIENKNDKPGKFEKLLSGFGSEDTHETLNTFQWGPDGWLYGLHGIFTNSKVKPLDGPETRMNAAVWRYHPVTKKFEIFAEGTSNPWGMDWRNTDGQFILACCVIPHLYHIVPGGIYQRQAGASFNPYAYGYIKEICDHTFHKESGWAHAGLISLDVPHMPERFRNSVIFGSIHGCSLKQNILKPNGSSYTASKGEDFLVSGDKNVRPINLRWGPNGDIYMIDWHDQNPCHQAKADSWDYERGRVYRIQLKGTKTNKTPVMSKRDLEMLGRYAVEGANPWYRRTALRLLNESSYSGDKVDGTLILPAEFHSLRESAAREYQRADQSNPVAWMWLLTAMRYEIMSFGSPPNNPEILAWWIRQTAKEFMNAKLDELPENGKILHAIMKYHPTVSPVCRRELASLAANVHPTIAQVICRELMLHKTDGNDPLIPHLIWTAYEKVLASGGRQPPDSGGAPPARAPLQNQGADAPRSPWRSELEWLAANAKDNKLIADFIIPRVMRRVIAFGKADDLKIIMAWIGKTDNLPLRQSALAGLVLAYKDQTITAPGEWKALRDQLLALKDAKITASVNALSVSFRDPEAIRNAVATMTDKTQPTDDRITAIRQLGVLKDKETHGAILVVASKDPNPSIRIEAVRASGSMDGDVVPGVLLGLWSKQPPEVKAEIISVLASRKAWAKELLKAMQVNQVERQLVTDNVILRIQAFKDKELDELISVAWGKSRPTPADLLKQIDTMRSELDKGPGSMAKGKLAFETHCAKCHKFDGKGAEVGPALDGAARDIEYLLANVLDPNRVIGSPYFVRQTATEDGQIIQGVLAEEDDKTITLKVENGVLKKLEKAKLDGPVKVLERSIMPEGLTAGMKPQDFRDLVRYAMAHPFPSQAMVNDAKTAVPVTGLIPLGDAKKVTIEVKFSVSAEMKTKLLIGSANAFEAVIDGKAIGKGTGTGQRVNPDSESFEVTLAKGEHTLTVTADTKWASRGLYARFLDPERRITYAE